MKTELRAIATLISLMGASCAQVASPVQDSTAGLQVEPGDKIVKWESDVDGDGKTEVFLSLKSDMADPEADQPSSWDAYIGQNEGYSKPNGIDRGDGEIGQILPDIDIDRCYVGVIDELGKRGVVSREFKSPHPLDGGTVTVYAYTIEGDHLKKHQLAQFEECDANPVYAKYLADSKKTTVTLTELDP